jgi:hypothetical protein
VVGAKGFEPSTSWSRTRRASQAALRPDTVQRFQEFRCADSKNSTASRRQLQRTVQVFPSDAITQVRLQNETPPNEGQHGGVPFALKF